MTEKHTPGPWEELDGMVGKLIDGDAWLHIARVSDDDEINYRRDNPFPLGTGKANSHLINVSPDLLEEVIRLRGVIVEMVTASLCGQQLAPGDVDIDMNKTDSIIAKARGQQQND